MKDSCEGDILQNCYVSVFGAVTIIKKKKNQPIFSR